MLQRRELGRRPPALQQGLRGVLPGHDGHHPGGVSRLIDEGVAAQAVGAATQRTDDGRGYLDQVETEIVVEAVAAATLVARPRCMAKSATTFRPFEAELGYGAARMTSVRSSFRW